MISNFCKAHIFMLISLLTQIKHHRQKEEGSERGDVSPTSSVTMNNGYLSSDRKLKMHQILKASSSVISRWLLSRFFLAQRVQHIL